jgi:hypothetical protein
VTKTRSIHYWTMCLLFHCDWLGSDLRIGHFFYCDCLERQLSYEWIIQSLSLMLGSTVSRPVSLGIKHPSEAYDQILLLSDSCGFVDMGRSLWREDGSVVHNCCWPSPAQSFSGPSSFWLATIFYCLRFEISLWIILLCTAPYIV